MASRAQPLIGQHHLNAVSLPLMCNETAFAHDRPTKSETNRAERQTFGGETSGRARAEALGGGGRRCRNVTRRGEAFLLRKPDRPNHHHHREDRHAGTSIEPDQATQPAAPGNQ